MSLELPLDGLLRGNKRPRLRAVMSLHAAGHMGHDRPGAEDNCAAFLKKMGLENACVYRQRQVHSRRITVIDRNTPSDYHGCEGDGWMTALGDEILSVTVADCLPILLVDREERFMALLHSGWQGTGIAADAIRLAARKFGQDPAALSAVIGPGIGPCCYEVDESRYARFTGDFGAESGQVRGGRCYLDMRQANLGLLERAGIGNALVFDNCTCCDRRFGSYRRDGREGFHNMLLVLGRF